MKRRNALKAAPGTNDLGQRKIEATDESGKATHQVIYSGELDESDVRRWLEKRVQESGNAES